MYVVYPAAKCGVRLLKRQKTSFNSATYNSYAYTLNGKNIQNNIQGKRSLYFFDVSC